MFLFKRNALGFVRAKMDPTLPTVSAFRELWHMMPQQNQFDPFLHAKLTLGGSIQI